MTEALREAVPPTTVSDLRSFLGAANVYRRFIKGYSRISEPLYGVLKRFPEGAQRKGYKLSIEFDETQLDAFCILVECMKTPPILSIPVLGRRYSIDTDASERQIGVALYQEGDDKIRRPIGFFPANSSRPSVITRPPKESALPSFGLCNQLLRLYLFGDEFDAYTDHAALACLMRIQDPSGVSSPDVSAYLSSASKYATRRGGTIKWRTCFRVSLLRGRRQRRSARNTMFRARSPAVPRVR